MESNDARWTSPQIITLALCFALSVLDGADVIVASLVAPLLIERWQVSEATFGIVFSSGLVGMTAGSLFLAPFADKVGRKPLVLVCTVIISTSMILSALADSVVQLSFLRLTTGLGVGGMHATIATLASEFSPRRHSAAAVMTVTAGYPAGAMLFGLAANYLLAPFGWQSLFVAAGLCSVALIPIAFVFAPESSDFLLNRRREGDLERANRVLAMQGRPELAAYPAMARMTARRNPFLSLFHRDVRVTTLLCWTAFVGAIFVVYFLLSWIPRVATRTGYSLETAIYGSSIFNGGAVVGLILVGWLTARWNLGKVIATLYLLAAASMIVFAQWNTPVSVFYGVLFAMGLFQQSGNGALYAVVTRVYGAEVRTTALGWAVGIGRGGAVLGPAAGGLAMSAGLSVGWMFVVFSLPLLLAAACSLAIGIKHFSR